MIYHSYLNIKYVNIELERGLSYVFHTAYIDELTGLPKDLTGYTARLAVRPSADQPPAIDLNTSPPATSNPTIILGGATGTIDCYFSAADSDTDDWSQAPYDLVLTDPNGIPFKLRRGIVTILPTESIH